MFIQATVKSTPRNSAGQFISSRVTPAIRAGIQAYVQTMFDESQALVPVDTGELKASGSIVIEETERRVTGHVVYSAGHAGYVEYGTGIRGAESEGAGPYSYSTTWPGMPAQPYLRPALDSTRETAFGLFKGAASAEMKV